MHIITSILVLCAMVAGADEPVKLERPDMGVSFMIPAHWKPIDPPPHDNNKLTGVSFDGVDDAGTIVAIQSMQHPKKIEKSAERIQQTLQPYRDAAKQGNQRVTDDREMNLAGWTGWIFETQSDTNTMFVFCFIMDDREFKLLCAGEIEKCRKVQPALAKIMSTIDVIRTQNK